MKTPTVIEALEQAIAMLRSLEGHQQRYPCDVFSRQLHYFQAARDEHRRLEMVAARNREQVRELSRQARGKKGFRP